MSQTPIPSAHPESYLDRFNRWLQESIMVKLFSIAFLVLVLLLPASWIQDLMYERQQRADSVVGEISDKWSRSQTVSGPVLVIPFKQQEIIDNGKDGKTIREVITNAFFLPEQLDINGTVDPEVRHRGIFDAVVYQSSLQIKSVFPKPDFQRLSVKEENILWEDAHLVFGITDLRGMTENPIISANDDPLSSEPSNNIGVMMGSMESVTGITTPLHWKNAESFQQAVNIKLSLKGSESLNFVPVGKTTAVKLSSPWNNPSFVGTFLPATHNITEKNFDANWKVLHFNRPFSQQWTGDNEKLSGSDFGVSLRLPVDQYQQSIRTAKYGILMILLTFIALFLVEITTKVRIHPFQYILIGAALIIYYTLLLSISEQFGYNLAYLIASVATVTLISLYASTFLNRTRLTLLFSTLLVIFYAFIFVIILQQDFSLLLGSVGLFLIVGILMYFSRKVKWYGDKKETVTPENRTLTE